MPSVRERRIRTEMEELTPFVPADPATSEIELLGDVKAGFPSPAEEIREKLDIVKLLVRHPSSTFFFRISGESMTDAALDDGDLVVVDRSLELRNDCIAVCFVDGEFTVKRVEMAGDSVTLLPANPKYRAIRLTEENSFMVWGIVTFVIKKV